MSKRYNSPERNKGNQACAKETKVTPKRRYKQEGQARKSTISYLKFTDNSSNPMAETNKRLPPTGNYILVT